MKLVLLLLVCIVMVEATGPVTKCIIESCSGWKLNKYPKLKNVLKDTIRGYENVEVKWVPGAVPTAFFYDSENELVDQVALKDHSLDELIAILREKGADVKLRVEEYKEPKSVHNWRGHRYELYTQQNPPEVAFTFAESQERESFGKGYPLTITSKAELDEIASWLVSQFASRVLLGASDSEAEGEWKWTVGPEKHILFWSKGQGVEGTFAKWIEFEPNNANNLEHCAELYLHNDNPGFNDAECSYSSAWLVIEFGTSSQVDPELEKQVETEAETEKQVEVEAETEKQVEVEAETEKQVEAEPEAKQEL